jgi:hypothetical protein
MKTVFLSNKIEILFFCLSAGRLVCQLSQEFLCCSCQPKYFSVTRKRFQKLVKQKLSDEKKACELLSNPDNEFCQTLLNKGLCDIAPNGHALAMAGQFITFLPERLSSK